MDSAYRADISRASLRRMGRGQLITVLGPRAELWDGGPNPRELERALRRVLGEDGRALSGLDLTEAFAQREGHGRLVELMRQEPAPPPGDQECHGRRFSRKEIAPTYCCE